MNLTSTIWQADESGLSDFVVIDAEKRFIYNIYDLKIIDRPDFYGGWTVRYEDTSQIHHETNFQKILIQRIGVDEWNCEYYLITGDKILWQTAITSKACRWHSIRPDELPEGARLRLERMKDRNPKAEQYDGG